MQTRALIKERARRNLLLLIDGIKSEEMLLANLAGISAEDFQELRKLDLIAPAAGAVTVGNPAARATSEATRPTVPLPLEAKALDYSAVHRRADQAHLQPARPARLHAHARGRQGLDDRGAARRRPARDRADSRAQGRSRGRRGAKDALRRLSPARQAARRRGLGRRMPHAALAADPRPPAGALRARHLHRGMGLAAARRDRRPRWRRWPPIAAPRGARSDARRRACRAGALPRPGGAAGAGQARRALADPARAARRSASR